MQDELDIVCNLDRSSVFAELKQRLAEMRNVGRGDESIVFGVHNTNVFKDGSVLEGCPVLRIFDEKEWKEQLVVYSSAGLVVKAVEIFKLEITQVVCFPELVDESLPELNKYELRYYSLNWSDPIVAADPLPSPDPRVGVLPKMLSDYDYAEKAIYVFVELKPLRCSDWKSCCVCGIQRRESIQCSWNAELDFCSEACASVALCQKKSDSNEEFDILENDEVKQLRAQLTGMNVGVP